MAVSDVSICNLALGRIGAGRITALNDGSAEARACNVIYAQFRDELMEMHPWDFAIGRAALARDATAPEFGYAYRYAIPGDCLRVLKVNDEEVGTPVTVFDVEEGIRVTSGRKWWEIEQGFLCTNEEAIKIKYITRITDPTKFSPAFVKLLVMRMAPELAMQVAKNANLADSLENKFRDALAEATGVNAQQGHADKTYTCGYLAARN